MASGTIKKYADGTDSGWLEWNGTAQTSDPFVGTIRYRKIGSIVQICFTSLTLKQATSDNNIDLGTMPSGWSRPAYAATIPTRIYQSGDGNPISACNIGANGSLRIYKAVSMSTVTTNAQIHGSGVYFV